MNPLKIYCNGTYGGTACGVIPWEAGWIHQEKLKHNVDWTDQAIYEEEEKDAIDEGKLDL